MSPKLKTTVRPLLVTVGVVVPERVMLTGIAALTVLVTSARPAPNVSVMTTLFVIPSGTEMVTEYVMISPMATLLPVVCGWFVPTSVLPIVGLAMVELTVETLGVGRKLVPPGVLV